MEFVPVKESRIAELAARFDIIPGATPPDEGLHSPVGYPQGQHGPVGPPPEGEERPHAGQ